MNKKVKILLMDDIHLEGRPETSHIEFRDEISKKVASLKEEGIHPIIIFAGDIGEGTTGIEWFQPIDCDIVYVLGNHEFWGQDYFEEIKSIQEKVKIPGFEHVRFLHNDTAIIANIRFIGGTLWSTIGSDFPWNNKNYVIRYHNVMGDFKRITAKGWYTEENIKRLRAYLEPNGVPETVIARTIEQETFNPLLETEESEKTANYIFDELKNPYDGQTIVVTHHLPFREAWLRYFNVPDTMLTVEKINDESVYLDVARGNTSYSDKDLLLLGLYTNNLSDRLRDVPNPDFWVHGHLHRPINDFILGTSVKSSPAGYYKQSRSLSYKEFYADGNKDEFLEYMLNQVEKFNLNEPILNNLRGFETTIYKFKELIENHSVGVDAFYSIANAFVGNHEYSRKEIEKQTSIWLHQIYQWKYPDKKLDKVSNNLIKELSGFNDFVKNHENPNDYRIYNIGVKVEHHSFLEKEQFKNALGAEYKEKKAYHYMNWLREINSLQLNVIRYKKAFIEFIKQLDKK